MRLLQALFGQVTPDLRDFEWGIGHKVLLEERIEVEEK
jgi:hypothetical protein